MSTTAPQPATTPIPVQLSEPEFTAFKYLYKNNFIFIPEILEYVFHVVN